jgi:small subunit ribosomal protein S16
MLVIRFLRVGKKNQPSFKIVVTDKRRPPRAGRFVEEVGFYNPFKKEKVLKPERIKYWLSVGAKPSDTVYNLLISEKIIEGKKIPVHKKAKKKGEKPAEEKPVEEKPASEKPKEEEKPKEKPKEEISEKEEKPAEGKPAEEPPKEDELKEKSS